MYRQNQLSFPRNGRSVKSLMGFGGFRVCGAKSGTIASVRLLVFPNHETSKIICRFIILCFVLVTTQKCSPTLKVLATPLLSVTLRNPIHNNNNNDKICSAHISTLLGAQGANPETPGQAPFSFTISVLGSFTCVTQHTGPTALRPIRRTKQLWLSVLLKDTSAATGQAGIREPTFWQH